MPDNSVFKTFLINFCWMFTSVTIANDFFSTYGDPHFGLNPMSKYVGCVLVSIGMTYLKIREKHRPIF